MSVLASSGTSRARASHRGFAGWAVWAVWVVLSCLVAGSALAQTPTPQTPQTPNYRFRALSTVRPVALNAQVLTAEERAFVAGLPEVRVGVQLSPTRPYESILPDGEITGIHPEMLVALAHTFGIRLRPVVLPDFSSLLQAARRREVDIVMTLGVTAARMEYLAYTLGATPLPGALFTRPGAAVELGGARVAIERDFQANDWVRRQHPQATIVTTETTIEALRAVAEGRADAYLGSLLVATDWLSREPVPGVELQRLLDYGTGYYHFGIRKDWAPLAAILNKGIQTLRAGSSAELAAVLGGLPAGTAAAALRPPLAFDAGEAALLASKPVWRVGAVRGLTLLNDIDERGLHSGIAAEYSEQVARRLGVALQAVPFDSVAKMLDALRRGEIDLVPLLTRTAQRAAEFDFSAPYVEMPYMLVARSDGPLFWNLSSLAGKRLALAPQHPLRELLARNHPDIQVVDASNGSEAMDLVVRRQADAAVEIKLFANLRINGDALGELRAVAEVKELPSQLHFAALRSAASPLPLVDRALADIPGSERQRMLRRWVAVDLQPPFPWRRHAPLIAVVLGSLLALGAGTAWWTGRLKREVAARRRSEILLSDIAAHMPGVAFRYVVDAAGVLKQHYFSPGAKAFLGVELEPKRTVLASLEPYVRPDEWARNRTLQAECGRSGAPFVSTYPFTPPGGRERWLHTEAVQTRAPDGDSVWTGYVVDVSNERELLAQLAREAESRNLMLASASHELRAPTHTLSLALQALPEEGLSGEQRQALNTARSSARLLAELLGDVLDTARAGHEPLQLRPRTFDLHQLLEDLASAWRAAARTKGLALDLHIAPNVPRTAVLDPLRLKQVLTNLLSNACKYTVQGKVSLRAERAAGAVLRLEVSDSGIGISAAEQALLFEPFVTLNNPRGATNAEGSSGLGLATCRRVAALMGGQITLDSTPGSGTRVVFTLPLAEGDAAPQVQPARRGTIVVCDDDDTSRLLLAHMLRRQGFEVVEAATAAHTLARWREGGVHALVSDLDLPGMGGLELIQRLRAEEPAGGPRTAIIVCSGSAVPATLGAAQAAQYDAYIEKPVDVATLAATLHRLGVVA